MKPLALAVTAVLCGLGLQLPTSATAATFDVTVGTDDPATPQPGSLRAALAAADATAGADVITFAPGLEVALAAPLEAPSGLEFVGADGAPATITLAQPSPAQPWDPTPAGLVVNPGTGGLALRNLVVHGQVGGTVSGDLTLTDTVWEASPGRVEALQVNGAVSVVRARFGGEGGWRINSPRRTSAECASGVQAWQITDSQVTDLTGELDVTNACAVTVDRLTATRSGTLRIASTAERTVVHDSEITQSPERGLFVEGPKIEVLNSRFTDNGTAGQSGGGLQVADSGTALVADSLFARNTGAQGAALWADELEDGGNVLVRSSTFRDNSAAWGGGAIGLGEFESPLDLLPGQDAVRIESSTFAGNRGGTGAASLYIDEIGVAGPGAGSMLKILNSTFDEPAPEPLDARERETTYGALIGVESVDGSPSAPSIDLEHNTLVGGGLRVGRHYPTAGTTEPMHVRLHNNAIDAVDLMGAAEFSRPVWPDASGTPLRVRVEGTGNVVSALGDLPQPSGTVATTAQLDLRPLGDNGGPTWTRLPWVDSVLVNTGSATALTTDQRGVARDQTPDVGAVEVRAAHLKLSPPVTVVEGKPARVTLAVTNSPDHPGQITLRTEDASARAGVDYTDLTRTLTWTAGSSETLVSEVVTTARAGSQGARTLTARLTQAPATAAIERDSTTVTIIDDAALTPSPTPTPTHTPTPTPTQDPSPRPTHTPDTDTDEGPEPDRSAPHGGTTAGPLPDTGSSGSLWLPLSGAGLLLVGLVTLAWARRRSWR